MEAAKSISLQDIIPEKDDHWLELLEPWTVKAMPVSNALWRLELLADYFHWKGKIVKYTFQAKTPTGMKSSLNYRTSDHVKLSYGPSWSKADWPQPSKPVSRKDRTLVDWRGTGYILSRRAMNVLYLERVMHVIKITKPKRVLEVGAGMGKNLLVLAGCFPDIEFTGVELTEQGVARAKSAQEEAELPDVIRAYSPMEIKDNFAHSKVEFFQGTASKLEFDDNSFDLVFSLAAVEQMELIRDEAVSEMVRVSSESVLMVEPFADFNQDRLRALAIRSRNLITLSVADVQHYGLKLEAVYSDWPQKISVAYGLAYYRLSSLNNEP